jgi:hypothetical protein
MCDAESDSQPELQRHLGHSVFGGKLPSMLRTCAAVLPLTFMRELARMNTQRSLARNRLACTRRDVLSFRTACISTRPLGQTHCHACYIPIATADNNSRECRAFTIGIGAEKPTSAPAEATTATSSRDPNQTSGCSTKDADVVRQSESSTRSRFSTPAPVYTVRHETRPL